MSFENILYHWICITLEFHALCLNRLLNSYFFLMLLVGLCLASSSSI